MGREAAPPRRRHRWLGPDDDRPAEEIAAEIAGTPPDPDLTLHRFTETAAAPGTIQHDGGWLGGLREHTPDAGPVPSSRFL